MSANAQCDGRSAEYRWRLLLNAAAKFTHCWSAMQQRCQENSRLGRKVNFAACTIPLGDKSPRKCIYGVPVQETVTRRAAKFG